MNKELFNRRTQRIKKFIDLNAPSILIVRECELILKAYFGSIFKYFIHHIKDVVHGWIVYIQYYRQNKKEAKEFWNSIEFSDNTIEKIKSEMKCKKCSDYLGKEYEILLQKCVNCLQKEYLKYQEDCLLLELSPIDFDIWIQDKMEK